MSSRPVKRVLVMIEYGADQPGDGEVFDLTALAVEMLPHAGYAADLRISVEARKRYGQIKEGEAAHELSISFGGYAGGEFISGATHLDDVVNSSLPDGFKVEGLKRREKLLRKKADSLKHDAVRAKLEQVAGIRHLQPIARFSTTAALPGQEASA